MPRRKRPATPPEAGDQVTARVATAVFDDGPLSLLPKPLREPRRAWLAIPIAWLLCIVPSLGSGRSRPGRRCPSCDLPEFPDRGACRLLRCSSVFAPIVETLDHGAALHHAAAAGFSPTVAVFLSAIGWGIAHSIAAPAWGLVIWWPFLIFSTLYVVWRQRGFWLAIAIAAAVHMLQNAGPPTKSPIRRDQRLARRDHPCAEALDQRRVAAVGIGQKATPPGVAATVR